MKKRKQDFHKHKIHPGDAAEQSVNLDALRERTMVSLIHLGQQRFNQASGGYSFENWMKSFSLLLDGFENSVGPKNLPRDYFEKRFEVTSALANSRGSRSSELDKEIERDRAEYESLSAQINEVENRSRIRRDFEERKTKITSYEEEKVKLGRESERVTLELMQKRKKVNDSSKVLNRIFGATARPEDRAAVERLEAQSRDLELRMDILTKKLEEHEVRIRAIGPVDVNGDEGHRSEGISELRVKLESISAALEELERQKLEGAEFLEERIRATEEMRHIISNLEIASTFGKNE